MITSITLVSIRPTLMPTTLSSTHILSTIVTIDIDVVSLGTLTSSYFLVLLLGLLTLYNFFLCLMIRQDLYIYIFIIYTYILDTNDITPTFVPIFDKNDYESDSNIFANIPPGGATHNLLNFSNTKDIIREYVCKNFRVVNQAMIILLIEVGKTNLHSSFIISNIPIVY